MLQPRLERIENAKWVSLIEEYESLPSTNSFARQRVEDGALPGTVIWARHQTAGRGRLSRTWLSDTNSLTLSVIWRFSAAKAVPGLSLAAGLWTAKALETLGVKAKVKWPNDVWIGSRKVAGLLGESVYRDDHWWVIMGAGINVNGRSLLPDTAVTLQECLGSPLSRRDVLLIVLKAWDAGLDSHLRYPLDFDSEFQQYGNFLGCTVRVVQGSEAFSGKALSVRPSGALVVETSCGLREVLSDDVSLRQESLADDDKTR